MNKKIILEKTTCHLCGSKKSKLLLKNHDRFNNDKSINFSIIRCPNCNLTYLNPRPTPKSIGYYYKSDYEPYNINRIDFYQQLQANLMKSYFSQKPTFWDNIKSLIYKNIYSPLPKNNIGKVLDVGCGNGLYLSQLQENGWDVYGVDMSPEAVRFANNKFGLKNVKQGILENIKYPSNTFDVITMHHVLEHLYNPQKVLQKINKSLKKDGLLVISTPNVDSINLNLFKKYWFPLETPRHLNLFNKDTIQKLADKTGFKIVNTSYDKSSHALIRSFKYKYKYDISFLKFLLIPIMILFSFLGRSDIVTFYLKKQ